MIVYINVWYLDNLIFKKYNSSDRSYILIIELFSLRYATSNFWMI